MTSPYLATQSQAPARFPDPPADKHNARKVTIPSVGLITAPKHLFDNAKTPHPTFSPDAVLSPLQLHKRTAPRVTKLQTQHFGRLIAGAFEPDFSISRLPQLQRRHGVIGLVLVNHLASLARFDREVGPIVIDDGHCSSGPAGGYFGVLMAWSQLWWRRLVRK